MELAETIKELEQKIEDLKWQLTENQSDCSMCCNKWHKVKEEGLPKNNNDGATYLLYTIYGPGGSPVVAHFKERDSQLLMDTWIGAILTEDKIVSWKECKLPTE